MGTFLFLLLLFSGLCSLSSCVPRKFHVVKEDKNWTEAQRYCRDEFTDLATINNMREMEMLNSTKNKTGNANAWIGLKQGSSPKWQWSLADRDFYREDKAEFRKWDSDQPQGTTNCTVMGKGDGEWHNECCSATKPFICYDDKLVLVRQNKTWIEALQYCREHHVDLVSVTSERIQRWVRGRAKGASSTHVWLGLRYSCMGFWFWVNGEAVCYNNLAQAGETGQDCQSARVGAVESGGDREGEWVMRPETDKHYFICTN
ncbi:macrophage mannose receptor 1-like [Clupea harengus]|uniref:Macrophage mannose receptor 1-like n=1 Tax=Clupea harengus TaxID=7950 RepID=A0A6P8GR66_CLUHA|nr:macrophage mannose receptor 1-like [Clupea harengus]